MNFAIITDKQCLLCRSADETHGHLFFECVYGKQCCDAVRPWRGFSQKFRSIRSMRNGNCYKFRKGFYITYFVALISQLWQAINEVY